MGNDFYSQDTKSLAEVTLKQVGASIERDKKTLKTLTKSGGGRDSRSDEAEAVGEGDETGDGAGGGASAYKSMRSFYLYIALHLPSKGRYKSLYMALKVLTDFKKNRQLSHIVFPGHIEDA